MKFGMKKPQTSLYHMVLTYFDILNRFGGLTFYFADAYLSADSQPKSVGLA